MDPPRRSGSWTRALDKVRAAMKRRSASSEALLHHTAPLRQETAATLPDTIAPEMSEPEVGAAEPSDLLIDPAIPLPAFPAPTETTLADTIAVDVSFEIDADHHPDEPALPIHVTRPSGADEMAMDLFAKYGVAYNARSRKPQLEPPTKIRRVEKQVRLRVHWTCHECHSQFSIEKTCASCGHRRCRDCTRHPPKRRKESLDSTRRQVEQEEQERQEEVTTPTPEPTSDEPASVDADLQRYRNEPAASLPTDPSDLPIPTDLPTPPPQIGGSFSPRDLDVDESYQLPDGTYSGLHRTRTRLRTGVVFKPKAQVVRRTCHRCDSQILPVGRGECANCGHERCELCPRYPPKREQWSSSSKEPIREEPSTMKPVQRVYRKARHRVRYTCENCNTAFIDSDRCIECGHERCDTCHREPPKRAPRPHEPEDVEAISRATTYGALGQPPSVAASAS